MDKYAFAERIEKTELLVEADYFAKFQLWSNHAVDSQSSWDPCVRSWRQGVGTSLKLGTLDGRPLDVTLYWDTLDGALVCFYWGSSELVDHKRIAQFLDEKFPDVPRYDADHFSKALSHIDGRREGDDKDVQLLESKRWLGRELVEDFRDNAILTTKALEFSWLADRDGEDGGSEIYEAAKIVQERCEIFRNAVWVPWLKRYYEEATMHGHGVYTSSVKMLVWGSAGRVMVHLARPDDDDPSYVSMVGYDGDNGDGMGVLGAYGTAASIAAMVDSAIEQSESLRSSIRQNSDVFLGIA